MKRNNTTLQRRPEKDPEEWVTGDEPMTGPQESYLKTLSRELAPDGITVNTIAPGKIDTDRLRALYGPDGPPAADLAHIPRGRLGTAAEIAAVAGFLASEGASYVTGTVVPVDGGLGHTLL